MEAPTPGGWTGLLAGTALAITTGFLGLRKWLSRDNVDRAGDSASLRVINMLRSELDRSDARNAALVRALDESNAQMSELRKRVAELTDEVIALRAQIKNMPVAP